MTPITIRRAPICPARPYALSASSDLTMRSMIGELAMRLRSVVACVASRKPSGVAGRVPRIVVGGPVMRRRSVADRWVARSSSVLAALAMLALVAHPATAAAACDFDSAKTSAPNPQQLHILLIGASGMIGSRVLNEATSRGHCVIAASRHPEKIKAGANAKAVKLDATDKDALTAAAEKVDVIVSATSPRGGGDPAKEAKAVGDAEIAAAKASGKRLLVVGGAGSLNTPDGTPVVNTLPPNYQGEARAMRGVLDALKASDIDWTFFSPPMSIRPGERTGKYQLGTTTVLYDAQKKSAISAEDFAHALVNELEKPAHRKGQMTIAY